MSGRTIFPETVYRRNKEPRALPSDLRLMALGWALYFAVTGSHTVAELGRQLRVDPAERDEALRRLLTLGLIEEQPLSAAEYVRALAASGDGEEKTLHEFLLGTAARPARTADIGKAEPVSPKLEPAPLPLPRSAPAFSAPSMLTQPVPVQRVLRPAAPLEFKRLPSPDERKENPPMAHSRKLSLRALMNLIETKAGSREAGQIDIYRVFVRVDTSLLRRSGIETLRFTEDRFVSDPELEQAIVRSVKKTLDLECPESLWIDVA